MADLELELKGKILNLMAELELKKNALGKIRDEIRDTKDELSQLLYSIEEGESYITEGMSLIETGLDHLSEEV